MFEGGGFGVGVTVTPLDVAPWPVEVLPPGVVARPSRLGEMLPVADRTDAGIALDTLQAAAAGDDACAVARMNQPSPPAPAEDPGAHAGGLPATGCCGNVEPAEVNG